MGAFLKAHRLPLVALAVSLFVTWLCFQLRPDDPPVVAALLVVGLAVMSVVFSLLTSLFKWLARRHTRAIIATGTPENQDAARKLLESLERAS